MNTQTQDEQKDVNIEQLFGSKTRVRLLRLLLDNPERAFYVRELTRRIEAQLNSVRRELKNLVDLGLVSEVEGTILPGEVDDDEEPPKKSASSKGVKKKFYQANSTFSFFEELRSIMKKSAVLMNRSFVSELEENGRVDVLFLTGAFIDNHMVPSDVLIVGKIELPVLQSAIALFESEVGREVNYTYMPKDEFLYRLEVKDRFLESLIETDKVVLINNLGQEI